MLWWVRLDSNQRFLGSRPRVLTVLDHGPIVSGGGGECCPRVAGATTRCSTVELLHPLFGAPERGRTFNLRLIRPVHRHCATSAWCG